MVSMDDDHGTKGLVFNQWSNMQQSKLREQLNSALAITPAGAPARPKAELTDAEWRQLEKEDFIDAIQRGERDGFHRTLTFIRTELRNPATRSRKRLRKPRARKALRLHEAAVSDLLAAHAERRPGLGIKRFRQEALNDSLLALEEVHDWIQRQAQAEDAKPQVRATRLLTLVYRRHVCFKDWTRSKTHGGIVWVDSTHVEPWPRYVQTRPGSTLARLRKFCDELYRLYGWDQPQAVSFVLTGTVPQVSSIKWDIRPHTELPLCSRIILEIDPTCTPQDVAEVYRSVRAQEFGRLRRLSLKSLRLAVFGERHATFSRFKEDDWKARLDEWNDQCKRSRKPKKWLYDYPSQLARECRRALDRLLDVGTWGQEEISMPRAQRESLYSPRRGKQE